MTDPARISFYDDYVPRLQAGQFTILATQGLTVATGTVDARGVPQRDTVSERDPLVSKPQTFAVSGPRFAVDPGDVHQVFPPDGASGAFGSYLPMLVSNRRALPWERGLSLPSQGPGTTCPWVALLAVPQQEVVKRTGIPLTEVATPPSGIIGPTITLEADEKDPARTCTVIDLRGDLLARVLPRRADARLLTHVREVTTDAKQPLGTVHDGWFSVVIAGRFVRPPLPQAVAERTAVHLVSLEGFERFLSDQAAPGAATTVRMVSLYDWSFTCLAGPRQNFATLAKELFAPAGELGTGLLLRVPAPDPDLEPADGPYKVAYERVRSGYTPLSYALQSDARTFAWYRGPFVPAPVERVFATTPPQSVANPIAPSTPSEALVFDRTAGVFDVSYAAAFQAGRSLALASMPFATDLLQFRRTCHAVIDRLLELLQLPACIERLKAAGVLGPDGTLTGAGITDLAELLDAEIGADQFADFLASDFVNGLAQQIGQAGGFTPGAGSTEVARPDALAPLLPAALLQLAEDPTVATLLATVCGLAGESPSASFRAADVTGRLVRWLAPLALLQDVPFEHLVADSRMLPVESIRFFHVDENWIDALLDGALSAGIQTRRDSVFSAIIRDPLHRAVDEEMSAVRDRLCGVEPTGGRAVRGSMSGFLLRSSLASNWPGLEVCAWGAASAGPMKPLRLDRVAPGVLLALYPDVIGQLRIDEPSEGLTLGVEDNGIALRSLPSGATLGEWVTSPDFPGLPDLTDTSRLPQRVEVAELAALLGGKIRPDRKPLTPAQLAVQLTRMPERIELKTPTMKAVA
jgi:hypothetical protein